MKLKLLLPGICCISTLANAQDLIATTGDNFTTETHSINFSIGEMIVETNQEVTQGFHQPWQHNFVNVTPENINNIKLFPNPTADDILISGKNMDEVSLITIQTLTGEIIMQYQPTNSTLTHKVHLSSFPAGIYIIQLLKTDGTTSCHKISKI